MKPLLTVEQLVMRFGGITAIDGLSLEVPRGRITAVIGPNGAGKTTLFNCITGFTARAPAHRAPYRRGRTGTHPPARPPHRP